MINISLHLCWIKEASKIVKRATHHITFKQIISKKLYKKNNDIILVENHIRARYQPCLAMEYHGAMYDMIKNTPDSFIPPGFEPRVFDT